MDPGVLTGRDSATRASPILITGSHYSGTTWVGKMVSAAPHVGYLNEPFNPRVAPRIPGAAMSFWFPYLSSHNVTRDTRAAIADLLRHKYPLRSELRRGQGAKDTLRSARDFGQWSIRRWRHDRPLLKDPIALLSTEWLVEEFSVIPVVLVRHPGAFASSVRARGASHPFSDFLAQTQLMDQHLSQYAEQIQDFARHKRDLMEQAALIWNILNSYVITMQARHPEWLILRHEDLCRDPMGEFARIFRYLHLELTDHASKTIQDHSSAGNAVTGKDSSEFRRDSNAVRWSWLARLTPQETASLRRAVENVADHFYGPADWEPPCPEVE